MLYTFLKFFKICTAIHSIEENFKSELSSFVVHLLNIKKVIFIDCCWVWIPNFFFVFFIAIVFPRFHLLLLNRLVKQLDNFSQSLSLMNSKRAIAALFIITEFTSRAIVWFSIRIYNQNWIRSFIFCFTSPKIFILIFIVKLWEFIFKCI